MTPEEKKAWAEDLLRQKFAELGRLPTKKDFDNATCAQIKAYLGPWPRALESAGLKEPKEKKVDTVEHSIKIALNQVIRDAGKAGIPIFTVYYTEKDGYVFGNIYPGCSRFFDYSVAYLFVRFIDGT